MNASVSGLNINTVGVILMIAGVLGLVVSLLYTLLWTERRGDVAVAPRERTVVRDREVL